MVIGQVGFEMVIGEGSILMGSVEMFRKYGRNCFQELELFNCMYESWRIFLDGFLGIFNDLEVFVIGTIVFFVYINFLKYFDLFFSIWKLAEEE